MKRPLLVFLLCALPAVAGASDQVVTDIGDNGGANQLRAKLTAALGSGGGTITFNTGNALIVLTAGVLPTIGTNITIDGANMVTLSGNNATPIFQLNVDGTLTLKNLTVTHCFNGTNDGGAIRNGSASRNGGTLNIDNCKFLGNSTDSAFGGGAIVSYGPLNISNSEFGSNIAGSGGALFPRFLTAVTTISHSEFHDNQATNFSAASGGAILLWSGSTLNVTDSSFHDNSGDAGGAIYNAYANSSMTLQRVSIQNNKALEINFNQPKGGGIYNENGSATLTDCTINGNSSAIHGGGIYSLTAVANLTRVTISGNTAQIGGGMRVTGNSGSATLTNCTISGNTGNFDGGGIFSDIGITLTNVTLSGNSSSGQAGGIRGVAPMALKNVLIAKGASGANCVNFIGGSFSMSDDGTCNFGAGRDNVLNLNLGPLANNGGLTQTHLPGAGSAAIDNGTGGGAPARDQRNYIRTGAAPDVGSVEAGGTLLPNPTSVSSQKTHGALSLGLPLPLTGTAAVESRSGGASGDFQLVLTFPSPVTASGATVSKGRGNVSSFSANGPQLTINLTGIANAQSIFTTILGVSDGVNTNDISIPIGVLLGDANGDGVVNSGDATITRNRSGQTTDATNFRADYNVDGSINSGDATIVRNRSGNSIP